MAVAAAGLMACGEEDTYLYDVSLDEAALSSVPIECRRRPVPEERTVDGLEARQQWRFQRGEMDSLSLEIPDVRVRVPGTGYYVINGNVGEPDVLHGSAAVEGGFQFLHFQTNYVFANGLSLTHYDHQAFSVVVETKNLDDTIHGVLWFRTMRERVQSPADKWDVPECTITIPFTGKRVKE
ncbi:putative lipoprotein [Myxococcus hansupus]|uniref:Putative lipoprotein n=1 Tax=Pseudomyxococcus hansupus TaxID=1297742 RepID=A0A0H4X189_9BACT|nr:putative lipoprotein [Myxococcus hansupus]